MEPKTRCLAPYIESIHYGDSRTPFSKEIFNYGITHRSPSLKFGCINRILLYPGSFNPPHLAHVEILRNGFTKSGRDMNIIAAIILPLDDEYCRRKLEGQKRSLIFTKAELRVKEQGYGMVTDRATGIGPTIEAKDGLNISWVALCGPEYVNLDRIPSVPVFGCKDIVVSDAGRPADFTTRGVNRLRTLKGCEAWEEVLLDFKALQRHAREDTSWVYSGIFMISPIYGQRMIREDSDFAENLENSLLNEAVEAGKVIRICHRTDDPECIIRFVPTKSRTMEISSTRVRDVVRSGLSQEQLLKELQQLVLYPEILLDLISQR